MTDTEPDSAVEPLESLLKVAQVRSDGTGIDTFARYVWQAKQAVRQWLTCFAGDTQYVLCEHLEDIAVIHATGFRFMQLKTRDHGSWSAAMMCDKGIKSLVRSYTECRRVDLHERATFELWLEGPAADSPETKDFVADPTSALKPLKDKILSAGLARDCLRDFLQRLVVRDNQPSRAYIDAQVLHELGRLWPAMSQPEREQIYERLLKAATAAQEAAPRPSMIEHHLATLTFDSSGALQDGRTAEIGALSRQMLSREILMAITPPRPNDSDGDMLARMASGGSASWLELKMLRAGAGTETIRRAQELRADMEVQRRLLLASRESAEVDLEKLADRLLTMAKATARKIALSGASAPATVIRSAEAITHDLLSRPSDLAFCDRMSLFDKDPELLYGYLGHLSDVCRFPWRAE
ncbi:hypothetical protein GCM10027290_52630 [Micromonospora sonneratiae]|uniref:DsDNA nuclease domain-containing protein n=1 Tax=Micromonospora sonneratiae TaxID=1184706 RepID=A0ABW3YNQ0_9ACTN